MSDSEEKHRKEAAVRRGLPEDATWKDMADAYVKSKRP